MTMTDESTVLDEANQYFAPPVNIPPPPELGEAPQTASVLGLMSESIADKLRADLKPRREWRVTKSSLQDSVSRLEREVERVAERFRQAQERAVFNGRAALIGWATVAALAVLLAWKWH